MLFVKVPLTLKMELSCHRWGLFIIFKELNFLLDTAICSPMDLRMFGLDVSFCLCFLETQTVTEMAFFLLLLS